MEFIGIGDLHLTGVNNCGGFSRFVEDSDNYIMSEVQRVVDYGVGRGIDKVIVYGDICDQPRMSYSAHLVLHKFFTRNKDIEFHLILGNHDKLAVDSGQGHSCEVLKKFGFSNVHIYEEPTVVNFGDCKINFLPYPFSKFKKGCLNVCHLDLGGCTLDNGKPSKSKLDSKGFRVVSGHIHSCSQFKNTNYCGTLYQTKFGESLDRKGFHLIEINGSDIDIELIPFEPRYKLKDLVVKQGMELPDEPNTFWRLIIEDQDIDPQIYAHLKVVSVKSKTVGDDHIDDLEFEALDFNIDSMLNSVLQSYEPQERDAILATRARLLK